jgi:type II secretory pathway pseudopilin PulG
MDLDDKVITSGRQIWRGFYISLNSGNIKSSDAFVDPIEWHAFKVCLGWRKQRSFSLLELLIVVMVVVILLSLLQPSFSKMIASAHVQACLQNEKSIGLAISLYATDHDDRIPESLLLKKPISSDRIDWTDLIAGYDDRNALTQEEIGGGYDFQSLYEGDDVHAFKMYACPSSKANDALMAASPSWAAEKFYISLTYALHQSGGLENPHPETARGVSKERVVEEDGSFRDSKNKGWSARFSEVTHTSGIMMMEYHRYNSYLGTGQDKNLNNLKNEAGPINQTSINKTMPWILSLEDAYPHGMFMQNYLKVDGSAELLFIEDTLTPEFGTFWQTSGLEEKGHHMWDLFPEMP